MSCDAERITGYVDGALDDASRAVVEAHLASCAACRAQVESERSLREQLRSLPAPEPSSRLEETIRRGLRRTAPSRLRWVLPLAAGLAVLAFWARGSATVVAYDLSRDHGHCFGKATLPALVWSSHPGEVAAWFERRGTPIPALPAPVAGLELVGARYCPLLHGGQAAHLYYVGEDRRLSVYVLRHDVRIRDGQSIEALGREVHLTRVEGAVVGLVSEDRSAVEGFRSALLTTLASWAPGY